MTCHDRCKSKPKPFNKRRLRRRSRTINYKENSTEESGYDLPQDQIL